MRQIKVRAWHKPYKQMCQVESLRFDENGVYTAVLIEESFHDRRIVDPDDFYKEASCIKSDSVESIMDLISEYEEALEEK